MERFDPYPVLESRIVTGSYASGSWLPTERELSAEFQVHRNVIRRCVARLAQAGLVECRHGHRPVVCATASERSARNTIAMVMGNEPMFQASHLVLRGCEQETRAAGYRLVYVDTFAPTAEANLRREEEALEELLRHPVAGVILWAQEAGAAAPLVRRLLQAGTPVVAIDRPLRNCPTDFVGVDNAQAASVAVEHLLESGYRRIFHVTVPDDDSAPVRDRIAGYLGALRRYGIAGGEQRIVRLEPDYQLNACPTSVLHSLLNGPEPADSLFAVNDIVAWRLINALRVYGRRVPEDIAVVGFDDLERPLLHTPFLTTIRQPFEDIGRRAAALLMRRLRAPHSAVRQVYLGTSLVVRGSTQVMAHAEAPVLMGGRRDPAAQPA
jgi:DNA-binding LacI/PurR family transcriptional regulator